MCGCYENGKISIVAPRPVEAVRKMMNGVYESWVLVECLFGLVKNWIIRFTAVVMPKFSLTIKTVLDSRFEPLSLMST